MEQIEITEKEIEKMRRLGVLDEIGLRNMIIRAEYKKRAYTNKNQKKREIKQQLADEYNLSRQAISKILYGRNYKKRFFLNSEYEQKVG